MSNNKIVLWTSKHDLRNVWSSVSMQIYKGVYGSLCSHTQPHRLRETQAVQATLKTAGSINTWNQFILKNYDYT